MPEPERIIVGVYYDFASSMCYVAHRIMQRLGGYADSLDIDLRWLPIDLTQVTDWRRGDPIKGSRRRKLLQVSRDLEVPLEAPGAWMDSRAAMAVALELADGSDEARWREQVWTRVYDDGKSLDSPELLPRIADELGLPLSCELGPERCARLEEETRQAAAAGVYGVPTFMLDIWPIGGIQNDDTMRTFLRRWAEKCREGLVSVDVN